MAGEQEEEQGQSDSMLDPDHPDTIGAYRILDVLGEGGMAMVYLAEQSEPVKRRVALKVIKPGMDSKQVVARFESERQALAVLDHPNIAQIFDGGITKGGRPYFAMELVYGVPINEYCDDHRLDTDARVELFASVCTAVQHAHHKGVIHRDLKPSNILVTSGDANPVVKIIDFGIAKATTAPLTDRTLVTRVGQIIGTPQYMSPEQAGVTGLDVDTRTDVYSLGVVLYELLVGVLPLDLTAVADEAVRLALLEREPSKPSTRITELGDTRDEIAKARNTDYVRLRSVLKGDLDWISMKAMEKERSRRYATVNGLELDVRRYLAQEPVSAGSPSTAYRLQKFLRRNRLVVASGAAVAAALVAGSVLATLGMIRAQDAQNQAEIDARTAEQTTEFMVSIFMEADPANAKGEELTAREILDAGAERIDTELEDQASIQATLMTTMGRIYTALGMHDSARPLLEKAVDTRRGLTEVSSDDFAESLMYLGDLNRRSGRYDEAEQQFREALALVRGTDSSDEVWALSGVLLVLQATGEYNEAEMLAREALDIRRRTSDDDDSSIANALNDLGSILHDQGDYDAAETHYREAIDIGRASYGGVHPNLASYINNLASLYNDRGKAELAEPLHRESVEMRRVLFGENHPMVGRALNNLALTLSFQEKYEEAEVMYREALAVRGATLGEDHADYAETLQNIGVLKRRTGDLVEAEQLFRQAQGIYSRALGDDHPRTNLMRAMIATMLVDAGDIEGGEALAQEAMEKFNPDIAPRHPWYYIGMVALAEAQSKSGQIEQAEQNYLTAIEATREITGDLSGLTQSAISRVVRFYEATNQPEKAEDFRPLLGE